MKRTNVVLDEKKVKEAKQAFDVQTTRELLDLALTELLRMHRRKNVLSLRGKLKLDLDLDKSRQTK